MEEIWKDIVWYEWLYQVSNLGNVRSLDRFLNHNIKWKRLFIWKKLKWTVIKGWYIQYKLQINWIKKDFNWHRLVASVFLWLDLLDKNTHVCHKDDNPKNNIVENLFLWTHSDNMKDMSLKWRTNKVNYKNRSISNTLAFKILNDKWTYISISKKYWISRYIVSRIKNRIYYKDIDDKAINIDDVF